MVQLGYHIGHFETDWTSTYCDSNDNCNDIDPYWDKPDDADFDPKKFFISIGIKNWNIENKFW